MNLISEDVKVQQDESPPAKGRAALFAKWNCIRDLKYETRIKEVAVDETQRKVWVVSELVKLGLDTTGHAITIDKERVDMMTFDSEGRLCGTIDYYRRKRRPSEDDEEEETT